MKTRITIEIDGTEEEVRQAIHKLRSWGNHQRAGILIDEHGVNG